MGAWAARTLHQRGTARTAHEKPEGLQHGIVGLLAAKSLDALAAGDTHPSGTCCLRMEGVDQAGFADPRFAGHEDQLPLPAKCQLHAGIQVIQSRLASYQVRGNVSR